MFFPKNKKKIFKDFLPIIIIIITMQFISTSTASIYILNNFRNIFTHQTSHNQFMHLKIFVDSDDQELKDIYMNAAATHNQKIMADPHFFDAGFDIFLPFNTRVITGQVNKVDFKVKCCAKIYH